MAKRKRRSFTESCERAGAPERASTRTIVSTSNVDDLLCLGAIHDNAVIPAVTHIHVTNGVSLNACGSNRKGGKEQMEEAERGHKGGGRQQPNSIHLLAMKFNQRKQTSWVSEEAVLGVADSLSRSLRGSKQRVNVPGGCVQHTNAVVARV